MKFGVAEGKVTPREERWAWFTYKNETGECRFELYIPDTDEHLRMVTRFRMGDRRADWSGCRQFIARQWMRDWEGPEDRHGKKMEPTTANREAVLQSSKVLFDWIHEQLKEGAEEFAAEKPAGGTD